jgi:hypothetical protein
MNRSGYLKLRKSLGSSLSRAAAQDTQKQLVRVARKEKSAKGLRRIIETQKEPNIYLTVQVSCFIYGVRNHPSHLLQNYLLF